MLSGTAAIRQNTNSVTPPASLLMKLDILQQEALHLMRLMHFKRLCRLWHCSHLTYPCSLKVLLTKTSLLRLTCMWWVPHCSDSYIDSDVKETLDPWPLLNICLHPDDFQQWIEYEVIKIWPLVLHIHPLWQLPFTNRISPAVFTQTVWHFLTNFHFAEWNTAQPMLQCGPILQVGVSLP